jgi:hypothetical protein
MTGQPRVAKVLAALLVSMTVGAVVLMVLSGSPPSAGAFCLSSYYRLDPVEKAAFSLAPQTTRWSRIEVYYSGTKAGNIEQLASLSGLAYIEDLNCHFVVCNGLGGEDGLIQSTERWQQQLPAAGYKKQTVRICVIADGKTKFPTDFQVKRTEALIDILCRKFDVTPKSIRFPQAWQ